MGSDRAAGATLRMANSQLFSILHISGRLVLSASGHAALSPCPIDSVGWFNE
jgi:hypothetical protein